MWVLFLLSILLIMLWYKRFVLFFVINIIKLKENGIMILLKLFVYRVVVVVLFFFVFYLNFNIKIN